VAEGYQYQDVEILINEFPGHFARDICGCQKTGCKTQLYFTAVVCG
jgi:hypothetical protein